jgi:hypothetical protein
MQQDLEEWSEKCGGKPVLHVTLGIPVLRRRARIERVLSRAGAGDKEKTMSPVWKPCSMGTDSWVGAGAQTSKMLRSITKDPYVEPYAELTGQTSPFRRTHFLRVN